MATLWRLKVLRAISSPLLETSISGAKGLLINITGSPDMGLDEAYVASNMISEQVEGQVQQGGAGAGASAFTQLLILISINLGLMNLLPIPGLDGSRLVFGIIEAVRGKPVPPQREAIVHLVGMGLLLTLMIFFTFRDVMRLFG